MNAYDGRKGPIYLAAAFSLFVVYIIYTQL